MEQSTIELLKSITGIAQGLQENNRLLTGEVAFFRQEARKLRSDLRDVEQMNRSLINDIDNKISYIVSLERSREILEKKLEKFATFKKLKLFIAEVIGYILYGIEQVLLGVYEKQNKKKDRKGSNFISSCRCQTLKVTEQSSVYKIKSKL